jgi:hypothetical protein
VSGRERGDQLTMNLRQRTRQHDQAAIGAFDLAGVAHAYRAHLHPERQRRTLDGAQLAHPAGESGIPKDRHSRHAGRDLFEQLQPFPADAEFEVRKTSGVAARPRKAFDEAGADRVGHLREHDGHSAGHL